MASSAHHIEHESSSPYVAPSLILEDSDIAVYNFIGGVVEYLQQRLPEQLPRQYFSQGVGLLSQQCLHFIPIEPNHPSLPHIHGEQPLFVRQHGIAFGILSVQTPIFSLHRLDHIARQCGWLLYREEHVSPPPQDSASKTELTWKVLHELTARQREVLTLLARGYSVAGIATYREISIRTVQWHCGNIYRVLDINRVEDAIAIGRAVGLT